MCTKVLAGLAKGLILTVTTKDPLGLPSSVRFRVSGKFASQRSRLDSVFWTWEYACWATYDNESSARQMFAPIRPSALSSDVQTKHKDVYCSYDMSNDTCSFVFLFRSKISLLIHIRNLRWRVNMPVLFRHQRDPNNAGCRTQVDHLWRGSRSPPIERACHRRSSSRSDLEPGTCIVQPDPSLAGVGRYAMRHMQEKCRSNERLCEFYNVLTNYLYDTE